VRPERTLLSDPNSLADNLENVVTGEVSELIYLGKSRKYVIRAADTQITTLQQITSSTEATFNIGAAVSVHWKATDAIAIADSAPSVTALSPVTRSQSSKSLDDVRFSGRVALERPSR
jgi:hypothetical protein